MLMKFIVELLAYGKDGEVREVDVENLLTYDVDNPATEILDLIFVYGQNDKQPREHPSVSVGDVIHLPTSMWFNPAFGLQKAVSGRLQAL